MVHIDMPYDPIQGQGQGHKSLKCAKMETDTSAQC